LKKKSCVFKGVTYINFAEWLNCLEAADFQCIQKDSFWKEELIVVAMKFVHDFSVIYRLSCVLEGVPALTHFQGEFE